MNAPNDSPALTALIPTDKADLNILLEPTRRVVIDRGYTISGKFLDQVCTAICAHLPITKVWVLIRPKGDLLLRLFFNSAAQRDRQLSTVAAMGLECSIDKSLHKDIAAAFVLRIRIPLHLHLSSSALLTENAASIAHLVEQILAQADSSMMRNLAEPANKSVSPISQAVEKYVRAFGALQDPKGEYRRMLKFHYEAPDQTTTAQDMAVALGYSTYSVANRNYGRLARLVCEETHFEPEKVQLEVLVIFERHQDQWHWQMRPEVAEALECLEWVKKSAPSAPKPVAPRPHTELERDFQNNLAESFSISSAARQARLKNAKKIPQAVQVLSRAYVRNSDVVVEVLMRANGFCERCKSKAPFIRASDGTPYLEVHHRVPLGEGGEDTVENASALCPNCHRYLHLGKQT